MVFEEKEIILDDYITLMETFFGIETRLPIDIITNLIIPYTYTCQTIDLMEDVREYWQVNSELCRLYQENNVRGFVIRNQIKRYCTFTSEACYNDLCCKSFFFGTTDMARLLRIFLAFLSVTSRKRFLLWQRLRLE